VVEAQELLQQLEALRSVVAEPHRRRRQPSASHPGGRGVDVGLARRAADERDRGEVAFARRLAAFPAMAAAVDTGRLSVAGAAGSLPALVKARPHLDRPDGLIDGQPGEQTLAAVSSTAS
jgi:hypothetical protein